MGYIFDALNRATQAAAGAVSPAPPPASSPSPGPANAGRPARSPQGPIGLQGGSAGADAVARVPMSAGADERVVTLVDATGTMAEEYRAIRTSLLARWEQRRHVAHVITSATPQEGKTLTTLNLGFCLAELHDRRTVIVEADLRLPQFRKLLPLPQTPGLVGVLQDGASISEAMLEADPHRLHILPAGNGMRGDAAQWLSSPMMASLVRELKRLYDHVIIDTPPVVGLADAGILGGMSDEVLLVARMSRTPRPLLEQAVRTLGSYSAPVAGVIATDISKLRQKYYYYRYGYRYHYRYYNRAA